MKWILRYLRGIVKQSLCFGNEKQLLIGYVDANIEGDVDSRKYTSGYLITFAQGSYLMAITITKAHCFEYHGS